MVVQPDNPIIRDAEEESNATTDEGSINANETDTTDYSSALYKAGDTPPMYALTLWFVAFCEEYFDDMFDWAMRDDPVLGRGSYGQTSRLCPERAYVMHKLLSDLEHGGWKSKPAFKEYLTAIEGVHYAG